MQSPSQYQPLSQPADIYPMSSFFLLSPSAGRAASSVVPRLGRYAFGHSSVQTPAIVSTSSRGAVPHLTPDMINRHTDINTIFAAHEDFISRIRHDSAAVYETPVANPATDSALRSFMCQPNDRLMIFGPRRIPPVTSPPASSDFGITILTSDGYRPLSSAQYTEAVTKLRPNIAIGLADVSHDREPGVKRKVKMVERTNEWTREIIEALVAPSDGSDTPASPVRYFAPILPLPMVSQYLYLEDLADDLKPHVAGLAFYDSASTSELPHSLAPLPRISLSATQRPQDLLRHISLGMDLLPAPFIGTASDAGIALDFKFPIPPSEDSPSAPAPLGVDMWSKTHAVSPVPLVENCSCYCCQTLQRAYVNHLLNAREMLAWTLLQIHNYHIVHNFMAGVRESIARGSFESDMRDFNQHYESEMPQQTGHGPRVRGFHFKSEQGERKKNEKAYDRLDDAAAKFAQE